MASGASKHKSFKRSYREDYVRKLEVPGMGQHIFLTFKMIFENWRIFLPLLLIMVVIMILLVGLSDVYLNGETVIFGSLVFLIIWLSTIFVIRHKMAGHKIGLRDTLYNALTPFLSSLVVLFVIAIQCVPIMVLTVAYSSAIETHFLDTPFYAFLFLGFAALMILLSSYLLSSSIMAFVAVSAPGLYPLEALKTSSELMMGRRIKFILRIILFLILGVVIWVVIMYPISMFDSFMADQYEWTRQVPLVKICGIIVACFLSIFSAVYFYLYYRWVLKYDSLDFSFKKEKSKKRK